MIDAYTIGITLALDNGVSEGLATIRRDLVALNGVVEGGATRLKDLTRAASDLQVGAGVAEPINKSSIAPAGGHGDGSIPVPSDSPRLDPGLFAPSRPDLLMAANPLMSLFSSPAAQPIADVEPMPANRPGITSPEGRALAPGVPSSVPVTSQQLGRGATIADFAPIHYPAQMPSPMPTPTAPSDGSGRDLFTNPGGAPALSAIADAASPPSPPKRPNISITLGGEPPALRPSLQRVARSRIDPSQSARAPPYDASAGAHRPSGDTTLPSAVPPAMEPQSATSQGDIYVDGLRLGRWVTDRLAKAAERPRAAMTGFDPRMTPTWPGAPIGA
jgi:hypothetical protein